MYEILWYLQTQSPEKATAMLDFLRTSQDGDMGACLGHFEQHLRQNPESSIQAQKAPSHITPPQDVAWAILAMPEVAEHPQLMKIQHGAVNQVGVVLQPPLQQDINVGALTEPLQMFFNCVGALFYIMNAEEVQATIVKIQNSEYAHVPIGDLVSRGSNIHLKTLAAEIAGMAAIGVVHFQLADPENAPPIELADYLYAVARHGLDNAIAYNPLRAMKTCALLVMYNIVVKASIALAFSELGLSLARNHGLDANECPLSMSVAEFADLRRTRRTLIHLQCWLSASLDYVPNSLSYSIQTAVDEVDVPPEDLIRLECVKVTIIKATTLHRLPATGYIQQATIAELRAQLSTFHAQLPTWMSLGSLLSHTEGELMAQFRPVIFYVHLFYLSAMMLLSRRLILAYVALDANGKVPLTSEARQGIEEGFMAAQTNARVMELMLSEGKVVQVCWLCIFTSYTAGIMIAYYATQKALHGLSYATDVDLLSKCISVLAYCAEKDTLAAKFRDILTAHIRVLKEVEYESAAAYVPIADVLFTMHSGGTRLHHAARDLLCLTHRPFSGLKNIPARATLSNRAETTMGTHLEWEWELRSSEDVQDHAASGHLRSCDAGTGGEQSFGQFLPQAQAGAWSIWTEPAKIGA
ncbi:hypothetical protein P153DRAFT_123216 [Dothidotthia symphoricarpi CBS 119687]|uniref:Transcription factor domain-containing protein n=1 Tax=Dothidotthia symphoricarpi CBS 119687 TaxID=1392245 RepID=A0A6A5ZYK3_9PLEO|nr:uncharacterized protein P153DRAFT_123216 [Dothidotthia symphoricarpi CBS 119687]KAF2124619.1 hypothetical protein P153DRAFT_123216 [Dothidotthia symphoricarpi CBS 119687]